MPLLRVERGDGSRLQSDTAIVEANDYGTIGSLALMPATKTEDSSTVVFFGNERGEDMLVPAARVASAATQTAETQAAAGFRAAAAGAAKR